MTKRMIESDVEELFLKVLSEIGYSVKYGPDISPGGSDQEREYLDPILPGRLKESLTLINPEIPDEAIDEAIRKITKNNSQDTVSNNHYFHNLLVNGIDVEYRKKNVIH